MVYNKNLCSVEWYTMTPLTSYKSIYQSSNPCSTETRNKLYHLVNYTLPRSIKQVVRGTQTVYSEVPLKVNIEHLAAKSCVILDSTLKQAGHVLNRVHTTAFSRETTIVYKQEYPISLLMVGIGQMSRLNACCLPIIQCAAVSGTMLPNYIGVLCSGIKLLVKQRKCMSQFKQSYQQNITSNTNVVIAVSHLAFQRYIATNVLPAERERVSTVIE